MLTQTIRWLKGYVRIRFSGNSAERFFNLCKGNQIFLWNIENHGNDYYMCISIRDFKRLRPFLRKTHANARILARYGIPFILFRNRKRKAFLVGVLLVTVVLYLFSLYIWNIHIEGNIRLSDEVLLLYLEEEQVIHGMKKSQVNSEAIRTGLRIHFPEIVWVSAEIRGTRLIIQIKENRDGIKLNETAAKEPANLIASKEGVITEILTRSGVPKVRAGETVTQGQLLVSGDVEILDDAGNVVNHHYVTSDATIFAKTTYSYQDSFSLSYEDIQYTGKKQWIPYMILGEQIFAIKLPFTMFQNSSQMKKEYPLRITENFYLPVRVGMLMEEEYEKIGKKHTKTEAEALANANLDEFLQKLMQKGVQIIENSVKISTYGNVCVSEGMIYAIEEISQYESLLPSEEPDS